MKIPSRITCPDCGSLINYDNYFKKYICYHCNTILEFNDLLSQKNFIVSFGNNITSNIVVLRPDIDDAAYKALLEYLKYENSDEIFEILSNCRS